MNLRPPPPPHRFVFIHLLDFFHINFKVKENPSVLKLNNLFLQVIKSNIEQKKLLFFFVFFFICHNVSLLQRQQPLRAVMDGDLSSGCMDC